jgi:hypothetical protein
MDTTTHSTTRDERGRFVPGQSGNPAGKLPGTRNRKSLLAAAMADGEGEAVARVVIDKALAGDAVAARFVTERLSPKPRGRAIALALPEGESGAGEVVAMFNSALHALASGQITPDEAVMVSRFLEGRTRVLRAWALERKLTRYEDQPPIPGDDWVPDEAADGAAATASATGNAEAVPPSVGAGLAPARVAAAPDGDEDGRRQALRQRRAGETVAPASSRHAGWKPALRPLHFTCISRGSPAPSSRLAAAPLPTLALFPAAVALRQAPPYVPASPSRRPA